MTRPISKLIAAMLAFAGVTAAAIDKPLPIPTHSCWYRLAAENLLAPRFRAESITSSNLPFLFAHSHAPGSFGAKAVAYRDSTGKVNQMFFPIRDEQDRALNHTLALGAFLLMDAEKMDERARALEAEIEQVADERRRLRAGGATYDTMKPWLLRFLELTDAVTQLRDRIRTFRQLASDVASLRERTPFQYIDPNDVQGFEFTAVEDGQGGWAITTFEVDSIITEHQAAHAGHSTTPLVSGRKMAELVVSVHGKIESRVRRYRDVYMGALSEVPFTDSDFFFTALQGTGLNGRP